MSVVSITTAKKKVIGQMEVDGVMYDVFQLNFDQSQRIDAAEGAEVLPTIHTIITEVMPMLPATTLGQVSIDDGKVIIAFAGAGVRAVEAMFPNAVKPEDPTSVG